MFNEDLGLHQIERVIAYVEDNVRGRRRSILTIAEVVIVFYREKCRNRILLSQVVCNKGLIS